MAHSIMSAVRPRSFHSPLLVGIAAHLHSKFGSRHIIDLLSSIGFSASYDEVRLLTASAINYPKQPIDKDAFMQFVFDNADHNTQTINGWDTFHAMGGIQCVSPKQIASNFHPIKRIKSIPRSEFIGKFAEIPYQAYSATMKKLDVTIENVVINEISISRCDAAWLISKSLQTEAPGWSGFMSQIFAKEKFHQSNINFLPFLNEIPSEYDTIFSVVQYAVNETKSHGQELCVVTFDQPLYFKARHITNNISEENIKIFVRLGGFHTILSYLGAIGFIMNGSGLTEAFQEIFAKNSIEKIMNGHAYSRALHAHFLMHEALSKVLMKNMTFEDNDEEKLKEFFNTVPNATEVKNNEILERYIEKFETIFETIKRRGKTAKLWCQYFMMVSLLKNFISADRTGSWVAHLDCVAQMLPYFHASGHFLYAKSAHLYWQDATQLDKKFSLMMEKFFTIRRTDKYWSGIPTDMCIEQTLNRSMKCVGGLTHGRGVNDSMLRIWTLSRPVLSKISEAVEAFAECASASNEQHTDLRKSSIKRDMKAVLKLLGWLEVHNPFPENPAIVSLSSGLIGDDKINCHESFEIGLLSLRSTVGKRFGDITFKRGNRVVPLSAMTSVVKIQDDQVPIDPLVIFQRICLLKKDEEDLRNYLTYELAPYPMALFCESGMRHLTKSDICTFLPSLKETPNLEDAEFVIDGGFLLHRIKWPQGATYDNLCCKYVAYVRTFSSSPSKITVVFDGYSNTKESTKNMEHIRRMAKSGTSGDVDISGQNTCNVAQTNFLTNSINKGNFIVLLRDHLQKSGIQSSTARNDADRLIVETALIKSSAGKCAVIVGNDTDLIVLSIAVASADRCLGSLLFMKLVQNKVEFFDILRLKLEDISPHILFYHYFTGSDTTSFFHKKGKVRSIKSLMKNSYLKNDIEIFYDLNADINEVIRAGENVAVALYGGDQGEDLNDLRYKCFAKSVKQNASMLATIPPTKDAMEQHSKRVFLEIQNNLATPDPKKVPPLSPINYGWRNTANGLMAIPTTLPPAPQDVLRTIFCSCTKGCGKSCGCRKSGLNCSIACKNCEETACSNKVAVFLDDEDNEIDYTRNTEKGEVDYDYNPDYSFENDDLIYDHNDENGEEFPNGEGFSNGEEFSNDDELMIH